MLSRIEVDTIFPCTILYKNQKDVLIDWLAPILAMDVLDTVSMCEYFYSK